VIHEPDAQSARPAFPVTQMDPARKKRLEQFQSSIEVKFKHIALLNQATVHRSASNEQEEKSNNERLEFLGDAILGAVAASLLYERMAERPEGDLARVKSVVVSEASLSAIALRMGLDSLLVLGKGEEVSGGRAKKAILADALEAVIGAYYIDSGFQAAFGFVESFLGKEITAVLENRHAKDFKTLFQEYCQREYREYPVYRLIKRSGPDHDRVFWMEVSIDGRTFGPGAGKNKKDAEQAAAKQAFEALSPDA
jgi:ribonuclease-3